MARSLALALALGLAARASPSRPPLVLAAWLLLAPNVLPWYALWLLPLLVLRESPRALLFTGTAAPRLSRLSRLAGGRAVAGRLGVRALEYGPCIAVAAWPLLRPRPASLA